MTTNQSAAEVGRIAAILKRQLRAAQKRNVGFVRPSRTVVFADGIPWTVYGDHVPSHLEGGL